MALTSVSTSLISSIDSYMLAGYPVAHTQRRLSAWRSAGATCDATGVTRERRAVSLDVSLRRILCIAAHPDDIEFTVAGSVARWTTEGREVTFCLATTGGAGTNEHTASSEGLIPIRERETREAARILGVQDVIFLGHQDGVVEPTIALRLDLTRVIRRCRPDVVVCSDPTVRYYGNEYLNHPDHRAVASAALDAVFPSSETRAIFPTLLTEGLEPHKVKEVWITGAIPPDAWIDISDTLVTKCASLKAHVSQVGKGEWIDDLLRGWAVRDGEHAGVKHAEAFRRMVMWHGT